MTKDEIFNKVASGGYCFHPNDWSDEHFNILNELEEDKLIKRLSLIDKEYMNSEYIYIPYEWEQNRISDSSLK
jgi:hypothetical protein